MSLLLAVLSLTPIAAVGRAYAEPTLPEVTPDYEGPLTWKDYTAPASKSLLVPGDFFVPNSLVFDNKDNAYVTKINTVFVTGNATAKVEMISNGGQTVTDITYNAPLHHPGGIAVDLDGNLYVSDNSEATINGNNVAKIWMLPHETDEWVDITKNEPIQYAMGVAVDRQGNVYAVDSNSEPNNPLAAPRILKLLKEESSWAPSWDDITGTSSPFNLPYDIAVDGEGNVFVSDLPDGPALPGGGIYKLSANDDNSAWTNVVPATADGKNAFMPYGIGIDKFDNLYAISMADGKVMKLRHNGGPDDWKEIEVVSNPPANNFDVAADSSGYLYKVSYNLDGITIYTNVYRLMASIVYDGNENTGGTVPVDNAGYKPNGSATVSGNTGNLVKTGYVFGGWNTSADGKGVSYAPGATISMKQSITLYASWDPILPYTVSYQAGEGGSISGPASETVYGGSSPASVPDVTPDPGSTFLGWSSDGGTTLLTRDELASAIITGHITFTAYFQPPVSVTRLALDSTSYTLKIGATHQTVTTAVYSDQSRHVLNSGVLYSSSNTTVATVDNTGLVTANARGQTVITAVYRRQQAEATVTVESSSSNNPDSTTGTLPVTTNPGIEIIVDGVKQEQLATVRQDTINGRIVTTVVLDSQKVTDKLQRENNKLLTIPMSGNNPVVVGELNGSLVKALESNNAQIQIVTDKATYTLPASQINIDSISAQVGTGVKLEDITVRIQISETSDDKAAQVQAAAQRNHFDTLVHPVDFEISASYGPQIVQANKFNSYVGRMIALPEGTNTENITTGVVLTAEGELFHVPTTVVQQGGKSYALINSLTNSTYSVIYNPREMNDVKGHWAKADVNDMSSRLIIQGVTATEFHPDASITRAEFAAIVTRALGIQGVTHKGIFTDVASENWYAGAVQAAADYKLIEGYSDGSFRPNQKITRQEAAAVLARATGIANLKPDLPDAEISRLLSTFADGSHVANWARSNVAAAIRLSLIYGRDGKLDLNADLTRAETAAIVRRFLQAANLINS
ncbi:S-layer homology domain-containing protein [Cohnella caldifontis]|uniref:S-layer homology domain-containing protein n=1 Tax=Cohnella caldifontis TaxID=3027471 RepID=UPI0023ED6529|nr:S-layer homology domain-containing protein [Cohnella sp. YIM B05605]